MTDVCISSAQHEHPCNTVADPGKMKGGFKLTSAQREFFGVTPTFGHT